MYLVIYQCVQKFVIEAVNLLHKYVELYYNFEWKRKKSDESFKQKYQE